MDENQPKPRPAPHPDFDGHLERPLESMTPQERLAWAWEGALLLHWAEQAREEIERQERPRLQ